MRVMTIDEALRWAFCEELCKADSEVEGGGGYGSAWQVVSDFAELGTWVDRSPNAFGVIPDFVDRGEPHADALKIAAAVRELAHRGGFEIAAGWNPFPEWEDPRGVIADEVAFVVADLLSRGDNLSGKHVANLLIRAAVLGFGPSWAAEQPEIEEMPGWFIMRTTRDSFNRSVRFEADGFDRRKRRPVAGAYRKYRLVDPLRGAIVSRLDWQLWQDSLAVLAELLPERLDSVRLRAFLPDRRPWARGSNISAKAVQPIENAQ